MDLDHRQLSLILARGRAINGLVLLIVPGLVGRALLGDVGGTPVSRALLRMVGVRDLVLGVGAITTLKEHTMDAEWVGMGAVADAIDGAALLLTPGLPARSRLASFAGVGAAVSGILSARVLADERGPSEVDS